MKSSLLRLLALFLLLGTSAIAAPGTTFTAREIAQGFRDTVILAKPRVTHRATVDAAEAAEGLHVRRKFDQVADLRVLDVNGTESVTSAITRLRATGRYEYVEPDYIVYATATTPNDTNFAAYQWALNNTGSNYPGGGTAGADIHAVTAWDTTHDASGVIVAVIDSGVRLTHEDLVANLWTNGSGQHGASFISGNGTQTDTIPNDTEVGHGSHVSGIIGAAGNNGKGITGVAWTVQLMELRFLHGANGSGSISDAIGCINYAITNHANIINASYGSPASSSAEYDAINAAGVAGIIFVCAAGNDTVSVDKGNTYPAGYGLDNIVGVAATTNTDALASYSNFGPGTVDLAAPGSSVYSCGINADNYYFAASGTSMASPHVAGALALLKAKFPADTYRQLINRMLRSVTPVAGLVGSVQSGGRLNLAAALTSTDRRPFNDDFASRAVLGSISNVHIRSNNADATAESGEPSIAGVAPSNTLWWSWTAPATANVTFNTSGSSYDTTLAIYTGTSLASLVPVAANDDDTVHSKNTSLITVGVTAGTTYQIAISRKSGTAGVTLLSIGVIPNNDDFANAQLVTGSTFSLSATTLNAGTETGEPDATSTSGYTPYGAHHTVWYKWVAPSTATYSLFAYSPLVDMLAGVYTGSSVSALTKVAWNDDAAARISTGAINSSSLVPFSATAGTTYYFQIDSTNVDPLGGDFTLSLCLPAWQFPTYGGILSSPAAGSDGTIYIGAGTSLTDQILTSGYPENSLYALNSNGTKKWSYATGSPVELASPAVGNDGNVYIGSGDKKLYALTASTGALKWTYTATTAIISAPAIASDGTIYFRDDTTLYALTNNGTSATLKWSFALAGATYGSPAIANDGTVYVGATGGNFYAVNPSGTQKWKFTANGDIYTAPAIASDGTVYLATLNGYVYALNPNGTQKWVWILPSYSITSSPVLAPDGTVYFGAYDHKLHALSSSGTEKWSCLLGDEVRAATPAVGNDGSIYIPAYDGRVYVVSAAGAVVRSYATAGLIRSSPMIANGQLIVGSSDSLVYAFALDPVSDQSPANSAWPVYQHNQRHDGQYTDNVITITVAPLGTSVAIGGTINLSVTATGPGTFSYQWYKDGVAISGATSSTYTKTNAQASDSGSYTVRITSTSGATTTSGAATVTVAAGSLGKLSALSARASIGTGNNVLIAGFVIAGGTKSVIVRGIGPNLSSQLSSGYLPDPTLEIYDAGAVNYTYSNSFWGGSATLINAFTAVGAQAINNGSSHDDALLLSLSGVHTAVVRGQSGDTGVALAEVFDADAANAPSHLTAISARANVGTGNDVLIAGFVITGSVNKSVLIRGLGPALTAQGVTSGYLPDPRVEIYPAGSSTYTYANQKWGGTAQLLAAFNATGASPIADTNSNDAALLLSLPPGAYTAILKSASGATGVGLVEVYEMP